MRGAARHEYVGRICAVSHRWEMPKDPDPEGLQHLELCKYLQRYTDIELVWYDFWCMPQGGDRSAEEKADFKLMLMNVNLLYLGSSVLVLQELSYLSRFWTQFEAWLSMQLASPEGLGPARRIKQEHSEHGPPHHRGSTVDRTVALALLGLDLDKHGTLAVNS